MKRLLRSQFLNGLMLLLPVWAFGQKDVPLSRTVKAYPLRVFAAEILIGYEHGIHPHLSVTGALGIHGSGFFDNDVKGLEGTGTQYGCRTVFPASGVNAQAGARWYPGKITRKSPFFAELLLTYRRTDFQAFSEYDSIPCTHDNTMSKEIRPLVQRMGVQVLCGAALRREKRFTIDMFGGLGVRNVSTDERQTVVPGTGEFYAIEPRRNVVQPSVHLGLSLGFNFGAGGRR